jgi:hypothetical protein
MDNQQRKLIDVTTLNLRPVVGYEDLLVTESGILVRDSTQRILKPFVDEDGYLRYKIWKRGVGGYISIFQHRAVALAYIPNPYNKPQVNHKDSNRQNNHVSNLEWVTPKENSQHCVDNKRTLKGEYSPVSVYTESTIRQICQLLEDGVKVTHIPIILNVDRNLPFKIKAGEVWKHISSDYNIPPPKKYKPRNKN